MKRISDRLSEKGATLKKQQKPTIHLTLRLYAIIFFLLSVSWHWQRFWLSHFFILPEAILPILHLFIFLLLLSLPELPVDMFLVLFLLCFVLYSSTGALHILILKLIFRSADTLSHLYFCFPFHWSYPHWQHS